MEDKTIVSLATYSGRLPKLERVLPCILGQTLGYEVLLLNVQDDIPDDEFSRIVELSKVDPRIVLRKRPARWRSFNKFLHAYREYPDSPIITVDDDILYPRHMLSVLDECGRRINRGGTAIVAHEANPVDLDRSLGRVVNRQTAFDVKLRQRCFSKFLSNCCYFPPHVFDKCAGELSDYDAFMKITDGMHDELWLWLHSASQGIPTVSLDYTYTFSLDGALPPDDKSLCIVNGNPDRIAEYDRRIAESKYGSKLYEVLDSTPVVFKVGQSNISAVLGHMPSICHVYRNFKVVFDCTGTDGTFMPSMLKCLVMCVKNFQWTRNVTFVTETHGIFDNGLENGHSGVSSGYAV